MRFDRRLGLCAWLLWVVSACVANLPVAESPCPCPSGYCCQQNRCLADADCARLTGGDNAAPAFTPSGQWIAYLEESGVDITGRPSNGQLAVHEASGASRIQLDSTLGAHGHLIASRADAVVNDRGVWTPTSGLRLFDFKFPLAISADGRFVIAWDQPGSLLVHDTAALPDPAATFVQSLPTGVVDAAATFSPTETTIFVTLRLTDGRSRILRIPRGDAAEAALDIDGRTALSFLDGETAIVSTPTQILVWSSKNLQPTVVWATTAAGEAPLFFALNQNLIYFNEPLPSGGIGRLDIATGQREILPGPWVLLSALSSDGRFAVVGSTDVPGRSVLDLPAGRPLVSFDAGCGEGSPISRRVWFSSDNHFLVAANGCLPAMGTGLGDLVVVDLQHAGVRTLIKEAVAFDGALPDGVPVQLWDDRTVLLVGRGGDLLTVSLIDGATRTLARSVARAVAVHEMSVAFTVQGPRDDSGLYVVTLR